MVPLSDQVVVAPEARMDNVLGKLQDSEAGRVLVAQDSEVVGIHHPDESTRWLRRWRTLGDRALSRSRVFPPDRRTLCRGLLG